MDEDDLKLFERKPGEIEFIPMVEFETSGSDLFRMKYFRPSVLLMRKMVSYISYLVAYNDDESTTHSTSSRGKPLLAFINDYLEMIPRKRNRIWHIKLLKNYMIPEYLVYLYQSPISNNKEIAEESIRLFLYPNIGSFPIRIQHRFFCIVGTFCRLLRVDTTTSGRLLYYSCRQTCLSIHNSFLSNHPKYLNYPRDIISDLQLFVRELKEQLVANMKLIRQSCFCRVPTKLKSRFKSDVSEFSIITLQIRAQIEKQLRMFKFLSVESLPDVSSLIISCTCYVPDVLPLYDDLHSLLNNVDLGLTYMDDGVEYTRCNECEFNNGWSYYLSILKALDVIFRLYDPAEKNLSSCLNSHPVSINKLIMKSKRGDDHQWLLRHKNLLNSESRRHLIEMMFPDRVNNDCHLQKMNVIIDRSKLLVDSFEFVGLADPISLRNGIILHFKNEDAFAGPEVFREWLVLLCQHLFGPQNSLFVSCPRDHQRLFPNPAKVDYQQLKYYAFCGRVIALALMHNVQIGIGFDRLFISQLAGATITLEDISGADPYIYKSCKDILEMDSEFIDSDSLGLTFVWDSEEEFGSTRKTVELCPGGNTTIVNSVNREEYIKLVIQHCFMKSIEEKVKLFIRGLDDVLTRKCRKIFFQSIELKDLDHLLLERINCERDLGEDRDCEEVADDSRSTPFQRIIESTLPLVYDPNSFYLPLTCKQQSGRFRFP